MNEHRDAELGDLLRQADEAPPLGPDFDARLWTRIEDETRARPAGPRLRRLSPRLWPRRWGGRTLAVLLAGAALLGCGTVYAARLVVGAMNATPTGTIAFTGVTPDGDTEIYLVRPDGTGLKRLTHMGANGAGRAAWSPDGSSIAFVSDGMVWTVNADGSRQRQVNASRYGRAGVVVAVDWSPHGKRLVLALSGEKHAAVAVMNADGSGFRMLTSARGSAVYDHPVWAPNGEILLTNTPSAHGVGAISSIAADGSGLTDVTVLPPGSDGAFSLSRNGRWLALFDAREGCAIYMAANGHGGESVFLEAKQMAAIGEWGALGDLRGVASSWSPGGARIAFASNGVNLGIPSDLYIVGIDGSGLRKVPNTGPAYDPAWQPH